MTDDRTESLTPLQRLSKFVRMWREKPLRGVDDEIYRIHVGTEWEASLRVSDIEALVTRATPKPERERLREKVAPLLKGRRANRPVGNGERLVGFVIDENDIGLGLSEPLFALDALVELAALQQDTNSEVPADVVRVLRAIAEGYPVSGEQDRYIVVENPDFQEERGDDPNLVIDLEALTQRSAGA